MEAFPDLEYLEKNQMINKIEIENINLDSFTEFGHIINKEASSEKISINQGTTIRHHNVSDLELNSEDGVPAISIFSGSPRSIPIEIKIMEKHPIASQSFLPIQNIDWLIVVSKEKNDIPDLDTMRCFHIQGDVGITYNRNVWHHPLLVRKKQDFWIVDRIRKNQNSSVNLKEYHFNKNEVRHLIL
jgi:ureidoglycolate lyase